MEGSIHSNPLYNTPSKWVPYVCLMLPVMRGSLPLRKPSPFYFCSGHNNACL